MDAIKLFLVLIMLTSLAGTAFGGEALDAAREGDFDKAFKLWSIEASNGDPIAQYSLGVMYYSGDGVPQDHNKAAKWYRKAADQGYAVAQNSLGNMVTKGEGVAQDHKQAVKWYRKAAEQGSALGQANLGLMYFNGAGVLQSVEDGYAWTLVAHDNGYARAYDNLEIARGLMAPYQIDNARYKANEIWGRLHSEQVTAERRTRIARLAKISNETVENRTGIEKTFIRLLIGQWGVDPEELSDDTRLREDLGADSLDLTELLMEIEDYFDISVGDAQWAGVTTVESVVDLLFEIKYSN